jgi:aerobic carbon-monoxide dehydrogenase small subunit
VSEVKEISLVVNGVPRRAPAEPRRLLSDFLRHDLGLTGTHVGCEHGVCGCCTVLFDGEPVRSCLMFAVTADGHEVTTVEGLAQAYGDGDGEGGLSPVQRAFHECHGLQCGFCTPGFLCTVTALLRDNPRPSDEEVIEGISGNLCRCTGYQNIIKAVHRAADLIAGETPRTGTGTGTGTSTGADR